MTNDDFSPAEDAAAEPVAEQHIESQAPQPAGGDDDAATQSEARGVRLQRYLASCGLGSRRECEELITSGRVTVNGQVATVLGTRVDPIDDDVALDGGSLKMERKKYYILNKPPGVVCTNRDPQGRPRVIDLFPDFGPRLFTVGRLDANTTGLILVTNDGDFAQKLAHPRYRIYRLYKALVAGHPDRETFDTLREGLFFTEGKFRVHAVKPVKKQGLSTWVEVTMTEGQNREIRRLFARVGHKVMRLERIGYGPLRLGRLPLGQHRELTRNELADVHTILQRNINSPALPEDDGQDETPRGEAPRRQQRDRGEDRGRSQERGPRRGRGNKRPESAGSGKPPRGRADANRSKRRDDDQSGDERRPKRFGGKRPGGNRSGEDRSEGRGEQVRGRKPQRERRPATTYSDDDDAGTRGSAGKRFSKKPGAGARRPATGGGQRRTGSGDRARRSEGQEDQGHTTERRGTQGRREGSRRPPAAGGGQRRTGSSDRARRSEGHGDGDRQSQRREGGRKPAGRRDGRTAEGARGAEGRREGTRKPASKRPGGSKGPAGASKRGAARKPGPGRKPGKRPPRQ
ncbi:MAG: pseudouridine synthase [Planctomycetaceae bacterium]|nr:pseudouridine synthase [Planctomycetaceae bacterium]